MPHTMTKRRAEKNPWQAFSATWMHPAVEAFRALDAADDDAKEDALDGSYLGIDLIALANGYRQRFRVQTEIKRQGIVWLLEATEALGRCTERFGPRGVETGDAIAGALLEGLRAAVEGDAANYASVLDEESGLDPEQMPFLVELIMSGQVLLGTMRWADFWRVNLGKCIAPLFLHKEECPFDVPS